MEERMEYGCLQFAKRKYDVFCITLTETKELIRSEKWQ